MSWLSRNFTGSNKNPAGEANARLSQIPSEMLPYFEPYINRGQEAGNKLSSQYGEMTNNPGEFYSNLGKGYKESPGYAATLRQALASANNAAAMGGGGGLGSFGHEQLAAHAAGDVANQDYEQYINHILGLFGMGQQGQQQQQQQGYEAGTRYGENLGQIGGQQAQYSYAGQAGQNAGRANNWGNLISAASAFAPWLLGNHNGS